MSHAGLKLLSATSLVGAKIKYSELSRSSKSIAVNIMAAAIVDLLFFLEISRKKSLISRR